MVKRKHISWKTKCASLLLQLGDIPYDDAKQMTKDQIISLYHCDHNILHETEREDRDEFWNLTHRLIHDHRRKTKEDAKVIAKGRRIRKRLFADGLMPPKLYDATEEFVRGWENYQQKTKPSWAKAMMKDSKKDYEQYHKIRSRGFDKTLRKKVSGKVEKR